MKKGFYPINLDISKFKILIVGFGNVGYRKFCDISEICEDIKIISQEISQEKKEIISKMNNVKYEIRKYKVGDVKGYDMVFACTNDENTQAQIVCDIECEKKDSLILANYCKYQDKSNFYNMSKIKRDEYNIAISTDGNNPSLSKHIRQKIENFIKKL